MEFWESKVEPRRAILTWRSWCGACRIVPLAREWGSGAFPTEALPLLEKDFLPAIVSF